MGYKCNVNVNYHVQNSATDFEYWTWIRQKIMDKWFLINETRLEQTSRNTWWFNLFDSISYCFYCSIDSIFLNHPVFWFFFPIKIIITFKFHISVFYIPYEKQKFLSVICFAESKIFVANEGENISYGRTQK